MDRQRRTRDIHVRAAELLPAIEAYLGIVAAARIEPPTQSDVVRELIEAGLRLRLSGLPAAQQRRLCDDVPAVKRLMAKSA